MTDKEKEIIKELEIIQKVTRKMAIQGRVIPTDMKIMPRKRPLDEEPEEIGFGPYVPESERK